jgi:hypothetical protein
MAKVLAVAPNIQIAGVVAPVTPTAAPAKPKFSKQQIAGRVRQLRLLYEEGLLTDSFYDAKMEECEMAQ